MPVVPKSKEPPPPILKYLASYPGFSLSEDIKSSFVRTSPESFYFAAKVIYESLNRGSVVWATDNLSLPNYARYWIEDGLEHLRVNHEATGRGIEINRIFVVSEKEYRDCRSILDLLGVLHAKAGIISHVVVYERLPPTCRYDFAIWHDCYVDEVIYDIRSNGIVDNYIHWSPQKIAQFKQKLAIIRNLAETDWNIRVQRQRDFDAVLQYAEQVRKALEAFMLSENDIGKNRVNVRPVITILLLAANPSDTTRLRLDQEFREIDRALRQSEFRDTFSIEKHLAIRVSDLQALLLRYKPEIVHFSGHGSPDNQIILEDAFGNSHAVSTRALSLLFSVLKDNIRCVVLNACYSETQARAIAENLDCVIGMSDAIGDTAAISFATAFYQALGYGRDVRTAFELGCLQIGLENLNEEATPRLLALKTRPEEIAFC